MVRTPEILFALASVSLMVVAVGCQPAADHRDSNSTAAAHVHDHAAGHQHAESFDGAVEELEHLFERFDKAVAEGNFDEAHDALHEIGHVADEELPALIAKSALAADKQDQASKAAARVMELYGPVDEAFHGKEKPSADDLSVYTEAKQQIQAAVEELCQLAGHDHDAAHHAGEDHAGNHSDDAAGKPAGDSKQDDKLPATK